MALVIKDRVKQTTTTTGTGTLTLNGTVDGFQTFAAACLMVILRITLFLSLALMNGKSG